MSTKNISPEALAHGIRWMQERLVVVSMAIGFVSALIAASSITMCFMLIWFVMDHVDNQNARIDVLEIYVNNLHAQLEAQGFEPEPIPEIEE